MYPFLDWWVGYLGRLRWYQVIDICRPKNLYGQFASLPFTTSCCVWDSFPCVDHWHQRTWLGICCSENLARGYLQECRIQNASWQRQGQTWLKEVRGRFVICNMQYKYNGLLTFPRHTFSKKIISEMEVALHYKLPQHCLHCLYYSDCLTSIHRYILFEKVRTLEWLNSIDYMQLNQSIPASVPPALSCLV